jgi:hypothetical protein
MKDYWSPKKCNTLPETLALSYFIITNNSIVGIIELFDNICYVNLTNTIIIPEYRGNKYSTLAKIKLMSDLKLEYILCSINRNNICSLNAIYKMKNIIKISDDEYEDDYDKFLFKIYPNGM